METGIAVQVKDVSRQFKVYQDKGNNLRERILFENRRRYEERPVLKDISFEVRQGEAVGIIGQNGYGKSTLLKLMSRSMYPDSGSVEIQGRVSALVELGAGFHPDLSGRENIYTNASIFGLSKKEIDRRLDDIIQFSELGDHIDDPVRTYSSGMYMRQAFSVAINVDADVLLVDEILAVGDVAFQAKCFNKMRGIKAAGTTIIIVSHSLGQIEQICDRSIWIHEGVIRAEGTPRGVHPQYLDYMGERLAAEEQKEHREAAQASEEPANELPAEKETAAPKDENRWGNRDAQIVGVRLLDVNGEEKTAFRTGDPMEIEVTYQVKKPLKNPACGIGIFRNDGLQCYGTNTVIDHLENVTLGKTGCIRCKIVKNLLLSAEYTLDLAIHTEDGFAYDYWRFAVKFRMYSDTQDVGTTRLAHTWEIQQFDGWSTKMSDSLKEFQRKIRSRKFSIDNSWKADAVSQDEEVPVQANQQEAYDFGERFSLLNDNILEADANKFTDGNFSICSKRKHIGKLIVFCKRVVRKLLRIFMGWYISPIFAQENHFRGKMVNAVFLERDLIVQLQRQIAEEKAATEHRFAALLQEMANEKQEIRERVKILQQQVDDEKLERKNTYTTLYQEVSVIQKETTALLMQIEEVENSQETLKDAGEQFQRIDAQLIELDGEVDALKVAYERDNLRMSDDFYHDFEEAFRGSQEDIKNRLQVYLPIIKEHLPDWEKGTFIDVGSGRGEWLDVLKENGATDYIGVDQNQTQNQICEERGHQTLCMDCVQYLRGRPDESVDLVTGFQIIEHLPLPIFVQMLEECKRVLKPGGMILFETQNPKNLTVGADTFYIDPSHIRPLEPSLIEFLTKWSGFEETQIIDSNATSVCMNFNGDMLGEENKELVRHINDISWKLFGPQDYAIFAVKG